MYYSFTSYYTNILQTMETISNEIKPLLKSTEVCDILKVSRQTLWTLRKDGKLSAVVIHGKLRYTWEEIERFIAESHENHPANLVEVR